MNSKYPPPFSIHIVQVGPRIGYRWASKYGTACKMNWLDPEPDRESSDYEEYILGMQQIQIHVDRFYRGFNQPPTEDEYHRLLRND